MSLANNDLWGIYQVSDTGLRTCMHYILNNPLNSLMWYILLLLPAPTLHNYRWGNCFIKTWNNLAKDIEVISDGTGIVTQFSPNLEP